MTAAPIDGSFDGCLHTLPVRIFYEDTDASGVVFHARYLHFLERGRTSFIRALGIGQHELMTEDNAVMFVVAKMTIAFKVPSRLDDLVTVETRFARLTGVRIACGQRILREGTVLVEADVAIASIGPDGKPKRLPKPLADKIQAAVSD